MAKNWKNFLKNENTPTQVAQGSKELLKVNQELSLTMAQIAEYNDDLKVILREREALEEKMHNFLNPGAKPENEDPRFANEVVSIQQKRKEDKKRFDAKQKLEAKILEKNNELALWTKKKERLKEKINKVKTQFGRKKKQATDFKKKIKSKNSDDYDYDKIGPRIKKQKEEFPFKDRNDKEKEMSFQKPIERSKAEIKEKLALKKSIEKWEDIKDKKREARKIKDKFERKFEAANESFDINEWTEDDLKVEAIEKLIEKKNQLKREEEKRAARKLDMLKRLIKKRNEKRREDSEVAQQKKKDEEAIERKERAKKEQLKEKIVRERRLEKEREARWEARRTSKKEQRKRKLKDKFY